MTIRTQTRTPGDFLASEEVAMASREQITLAPTTGLEPGTILGRITATGKYVAHDPAASDGSQNVACVLYAAVKASPNDQRAVAIARRAEVSAPQLTGLSGAAAAGLAALRIIVRGEPALDLAYVMGDFVEGDYVV